MVGQNRVAVELDLNGFPLLVGSTGSTDFPLGDSGITPLQAGNAGNNDAFVARFDLQTDVATVADLRVSVRASPAPAV